MAQIDINDLRFEICRGFDIFMQALNDSVQFKRYDKCLDAEVYFIPVLNEILKNKISNPTCNLVPCPPGKTAIDLVDDLNHITFQVSKQKTSKKIRDTFELFIKNKYFKEYNKLYFLLYKIYIFSLTISFQGIEYICFLNKYSIIVKSVLCSSRLFKF